MLVELIITNTKIKNDNKKTSQLLTWFKKHQSQPLHITAPLFLQPKHLHRSPWQKITTESNFEITQSAFSAIGIHEGRGLTSNDKTAHADPVRKIKIKAFYPKDAPKSQNGPLVSAFLSIVIMLKFVLATNWLSWDKSSNSIKNNWFIAFHHW